MNRDDEDRRVGYRLDRLEVYNWGTFDQRVWALEPHGENALLTGDIGSGKSTIVDAVTTLLLPANRISYNRAAGAETRERSLRSYVLGYYKSERSEKTGSSRPVGLRDARSFSVLLGVFGNPGYNSTVTLAQVFWFKDGNQSGQPDRFYLTADRALSVADDFADFGSDIAGLKRKLRKSGARVHDHFPEYGKDYRRRLGIESDQAMDLFHQTVSMKSVGNLNEFVRSHMLEPFDAADSIKRLVAHFEDLTKAHDAVSKARAQLADLEPLLADCDAHDRLGAEVRSLRDQRDALQFYFADRKSVLLREHIGSLTEQIGLHSQQLDQVTERLRQLRGKKSQLELERAGHGGNRLGEIESEINHHATMREEREKRFNRFNTQLGEVGLPAVDEAHQFAARRREIEEHARRAEESHTDIQNELTEIGVQESAVLTQARDVNAELLSLRSRRSNIPKRSLDLREVLCRELRLGEAELPFAGELIQVRADHAEWEGAAERLLRGFGLSLLVAGEHYPAVSDWINEHHLGTRIVYYRVPEVVSRQADPNGTPSGHDLFSKLEIKDSPFHSWLERELVHRAGYDCVETMQDFRRAARAITKTGQIKGDRGRHEKNDATRIDDRSSYVLGWSNQQKIDVLVEQAHQIQRRQNDLTARQKDMRDALGRAGTLRDTFAKLTEVTEYAEIDWQTPVNRIADLTGEKRRIEEASHELRAIADELDMVEHDIEQGEAENNKFHGLIGQLEGDRTTARHSLLEAARLLEDPRCEQARELFVHIAEHVRAMTLAKPGDCDTCQQTTTADITSQVEAKESTQSSLANKVVSRMGDFRTKYPQETTEFDNSIRSASDYRQFHDRLVSDDLPRFEAEFKEYLNTNTIRDIAGFQSQLTKQADLIKRRIDTINDSLVDIDYNPARYIRVEHQPTPNVEIRDFRTELRECTSGSLTGEDSEQYSEQKFLQVKRIIERFQGREGQTEADRAWTRRVTDVRNWFVFSASERWRADDTEYEHYTDSGGKSGGQKEKLAYTILAASLAYQFKLEWGARRSKTFRFVVIDEAFGRGSDESTRFALGLFQRLGLQLLIVTPLQKIHVIEPHVASVGFVDNKAGSYSRLQTLTIEEYQQRQIAHARQRGTAVA